MNRYYFIAVSVLFALLFNQCSKNSTAPNPPPTSGPALIAPANSASFQATNDLTLSWGTVSGAESYSLQVSQTSSFAATTVSQTGISANQSSVSGMTIGTTYYWRVNASGSFGTSEWSTAYSFSTAGVDLPVMISIPGGPFTMGSTDTVDFPMAVPAHSVTLSPFFMSKTLVTQRLYQAVVGFNPSHWPITPEHPVEQISWDTSVLFCNKLSKLAGLDTVYSYDSIVYGQLWGWKIDYSKNGYRMPTEAEFEYAYRAGTTTDYYWGRNYPPVTPDDSMALDSNAWWYMNDSLSTSAVATKKPNPWGLYDMAGNLFTWCNDWYNGDYQGVPGGTDPTGPATGDEHVARGGSWGFYDCGSVVAYPLAAPFRWHMWPFMTSWSVGLRVVRGH